MGIHGCLLWRLSAPNATYSHFGVKALNDVLTRVFVRSINSPTPLSLCTLTDEELDRKGVYLTANERRHFYEHVVLPIMAVRWPVATNPETQLLEPV